MADPGALFRLTGQVAVVTGGGSGIGRAAAEALAEAGAFVAVADIDAPSAGSVAEAIGAAEGRAEAVALDVTDAAAVEDAFARIAGEHGGIHILVNSAGVAKRAPTEALALEDWERVMAVNVTGVFLCCRETGRHMLARRRGSIVNVASIMGMVGNPLYPNLAYHASKGAVVNLTRTLAVEWAASGVRVNAIAPTFARTKLTEKLLSDPEMQARIEAMTPMGRLAEPEDFKGAVLFLASPASAMVTGHILAVDGGWLAR
jgi:NAD(P)-dependent dehydrogenase (short-subunit alcohol dehydrogenase family)